MTELQQAMARFLNAASSAIQADMSDMAHDRYTGGPESHCSQVMSPQAGSRWCPGCGADIARSKPCEPWCPTGRQGSGYR